MSFEINTTEFVLPFLVDLCDEIDSGHELWDLEEMLPKEAVYLGSIDSELANWTHWTIKEEYYIIPLANEDFDWALFRILWDDNNGKWDWSADARLKGQFKNPEPAAIEILKHLWPKWDIDFQKNEESPYFKLLNGLQRQICKK
ncbi:MAG: hypothetical protein IPQ08_10465 [Chitinophagaceae bacterium]|nr:hypothetical protein [Chitinophagaceae bacterium]